MADPWVKGFLTEAVLNYRCVSRCRSPTSGPRRTAQTFGFGARARRRSSCVIIDVFNHFMPKTYFARAQRLVPEHPAATAFPRLATLWDVEARLRLLDAFGDYVQVLSL